jgi:hypothetical protein
MSTYIIFFGKSQDFTTCYYDRDNPIHEFNTVIKDFDLLESKIFTVDDLKNKEILSRYFFTAQGKSYCLLKLYSFAQAYSGNRIAGSIYGVGLLSDKAINFSKNNLELLRVAKDNFAKLSLDGAKFNKSDFKDDTDRIWKAIVSNNDGNLIDKISTSPLRINGSGGQVAFFVNNLFVDAVKLNDRISKQDSVYFSEDLEHLKRTQNKWGKEFFPIYWEQNNQFEPFKEPVVEQKPTSVPGDPSSDNSKSQVNDIAKLRSELSDSQYINRNLQHDLENLKDKHKLFTYIIYGLLGLLIFLLLYIIFFSGDSKKEVVIQSPIPKENLIQKQEQRPDPISIFLTDDKSVDNGIVFLQSVKFIYSFDVKKSAADSSKFHKQFQTIQDIAEKNNINFDVINNIYFEKSEQLKMLVSTQEKSTNAIQLPTQKKLNGNEGEKSTN